MILNYLTPKRIILNWLIEISLISQISQKKINDKNEKIVPKQQLDINKVMTNKFNIKKILKKS